MAKVKAVLYPWRRFTISVDGVDHSGKSTLARFLAWQLGMPAIETDLFLLKSDGDPLYDWDILKRIVSSRLDLNRPAIVEGVFVRRILEKIGVAPDFYVYVEREGHVGAATWEAAFAQYTVEYSPKQSAHFVFVHKGGNGS